MRLLSADFIAHWPDRIFNVHPSLLPKYKGLHTHTRVLEAGDIEHGATVHKVDETLDGGEIIAQVRMPVVKTDTAESLATRLLPLEHALYVNTLKKVIADDFNSND